MQKFFIIKLRSVLIKKRLCKEEFNSLYPVDFTPL